MPTTQPIKLWHNATPRIDDDNIQRAAEFIRRTGVVHYPRLSLGSKLLLTVSALMAAPDGSTDPAVLQAALADPTVVDVARGVIAGIEAVA